MPFIKIVLEVSFIFKDCGGIALGSSRNLITILLSGSQPGLEVLNTDNEWVRVDSNKGWLVINAGDMLNKCSNN